MKGLLNPSCDVEINPTEIGFGKLTHANLVPESVPHPIMAHGLQYDWNESHSEPLSRSDSPSNRAHSSGEIEMKVLRLIDKNLKVKDVMCYGIEVVAPSMPLSDAARKMQTENIGCLPVGTDDSLLGIVTDRDLAIRGLTYTKNPHTLTVGEIMTRGVITCGPDDHLMEILKILDKNEIRRIIVLDDRSKPMATLSIDDYFVWSLSCTESERSTYKETSRAI